MSIGRRQIEMFFFDAGGGHRSAATALRQVMAERYHQWDVRLVQLQELLKGVDVTKAITGVTSEELYNKFLKSGFTYGSGAMLRGLQRGIKLSAPKLENKLRQHWQQSRPDLVVSLIPNFNRILFDALRAVHADVPYVTVMTDLADSPPHFWQERQDQYLICGTQRAVSQAYAQGYKPQQVHLVSGMILRPQFYAAAEETTISRESLGLSPNIPTALIMFGGYASNEAAAIVRRLTEAPRQLQMIVMCGRNEKLRAELNDIRNCVAVGFTDRVPDYMRIADFFIGKPGPGSISEAVHMGLPVILERNRRTLLQERYNTDWVEEHGVGLVIRNFSQIIPAIETLVGNDLLDRFKANAGRLTNRAVYQVPDHFAKIMRVPVSANSTLG